MLKLAGKIIDSYDDPQFVSRTGASHTIPGPEAVSTLRDRDFAVIIKTAAGTSRKYPIATPELVKISAAYFEEYGHQLPEEIQEAAAYYIEKAGARHGIPVSVEVKIGGDVPHVFEVGEQVDSNIAVPLDKEAAYKRAEDEFLAYYGRMTPLERALAANDLAKVANIQDPRVYDYVIKSQLGPNLRAGVNQRLAMLRDDPIKTASFKKLLKSMRDSDCGRAAVLLHQFDKLAGYEDHVLDAFQTCWGGFVKSAGSKHDVMSYKITTLARAHGDQVSRVFAKEIADAFLRDPVGYYENRAPGQVKSMLTYLANQVGKKTPNSEVNRKEVSEAVKAIRADDYTPWSKTLTEIRSV